MLRTLPNLFLLTLFSKAAIAQCGYPVTIHSSSNYCLGSTLIAASPHALAQIVWYRDGQPLTTAQARQSLDTVGVIAAGGKTVDKDQQLVTPTGLFVDNSDNLYVYDLGNGSNGRVMKYRPGIVIGEALPGIIGYPFVDQEGDVYVSQNDSVVEYPAGATSPTLIATVDPGTGIGLSAGLNADCQGNVFVPDNGTILQVSRGSNTPVSYPPTGFYPITYALDKQDNIFAVNPHTQQIAEWKQGAAAWTILATGQQGASLEIPIGIWMDGKDTAYVCNLYYAQKTGSILKLAPGSVTPTVLVSHDKGSVSPQGITMDRHGDIFVSDAYWNYVLEYKRHSIIDSAFTPTVTGKYYAVVTDIQGYTQTSDTVLMGDPNAPRPFIQVSATATSTPVCTPISFSAQSSNVGLNPAYQWEVSGVPVGDGSLSYSNNLFANGDQVYCILTSLAGCQNNRLADTSNIITLDIDPQSTASVAISTPKTAFCKGDPAIFTAKVSDDPVAPDYQWLLDGNPIAGATNPTYENDTLGNRDVITCIIGSNNVCGHAKSNSIPVYVDIPPTVQDGLTYTILHGKSVLLDPVTSGDIATWTWTPGGSLSDSTIADPVASPKTTTLYTLKVASALGCSGSGMVLVNVYLPLSIPNAFTPNGDRRNDSFYLLGGPTGSLIENFVIFNRWGGRVFQQHDVPPGDPGYGWNGRINGAPAPPDTYVYMITLRLTDGSRQSYRGTVILIR